MGSLLVNVKAKMAIYAHEKVRGVLEGEYGSVFKGRSMDFDDLREYIPGDDVKDIDWKATARSGSTLIRRYIAIRKHNIMLVVDTGKNMSAVSADGSSKKQIAVLLAGVMTTLALKHGDLIGLVSGNKDRSKYMPLKTGNVHAEQVLQESTSQIPEVRITESRAPEPIFIVQGDEGLDIASIDGLLRSLVRLGLGHIRVEAGRLYPKKVISSAARNRGDRQRNEEESHFSSTRPTHPDFDRLAHDSPLRD